MKRQQFIEFIENAMLSLPQDLKTVLRMVEDPEIDDQSRLEAAGSLLHVLSASNAIPGLRGLLAYVDDILVLRLVLERMLARSAEAMENHRKESPELLDNLKEHLATTRAYLSDRMAILDKAVEGVPKLNYHGHTAEQCVANSDGLTWLYDTVQEAVVNQFDFDEDEVARSVKSIDEVLSNLNSISSKSS